MSPGRIQFFLRISSEQSSDSAAGRMKCSTRIFISAPRSPAMTAHVPNWPTSPEVPMPCLLYTSCRLRSIPIFTFVNKMDRAGRDPFELMEEIEQVLGIRSCPVNWPIGIHGDFKGVYHRDTRQIELYRGGDHGQTQVEVRTVSFDDPACAEIKMCIRDRQKCSRGFNPA